MVVFFNIVMFALGVHLGRPLSFLMGFVLIKEIEGLTEQQTPKSLAALIGLMLVPTLCLYGVVSGNLLLICLIALAGYLVEEQRALLDDAVEKLVVQDEMIGELSDELANHYSQKVTLLLADSSLAAAEEELRESAEAKAQADFYYRELLVTQQKLARAQAELEEVSQFLSHDEQETQFPSRRRGWEIENGTPVKAHRNGRKGRTLRDHRP